MLFSTTLLLAIITSLSELVVGLPIYESMKKLDEITNYVDSTNSTNSNYTGFVKLDARKARGSTFVDSDSSYEPYFRFVKRENGELAVSLENQSVFYSVELAIGSNSQIVKLLVDTGSSDMWVVGSGNACSGTTSSKAVSLDTEMSNDNFASYINHRVHHVSSKKKIINKVPTTVKKREAEAEAEAQGIPCNSSAKDYDSDIYEYTNKNDKTQAVSTVTSVTTKVGIVTATVVENGSPVKTDTTAATTTTTTSATTKTASQSSQSKTEVATTVSVSGTMVSGTGSCQYGIFDSSDSTSWSSNNTDFSITYVDETYGKGTWGQDDVTLNGITIHNMNFADANEATSDMGVLGIGYEYLESTYDGTEGTTYENLPMKLKSEGYINKITYSVYLNDSDSGTASVLFGGIDHDKYTGDLTSIPIVNSNGTPRPQQVMITLNSIGIGSSSSSSSSSSDTTIGSGIGQALLDTGTTLTYFPSDVLKNLVSELGLSSTDSSGNYQIDCSKGSDYHLTFNFQGAEIQASLSSFLLNGGTYSADTSSTDSCILAISENDDYFLLGDVFLRNVYMVVDLESDVVALASANYASTTEDIEAISGDIPSATACTGTSSWTSGATFKAAST